MAELRFQGKHILVTGSSRGIGATVARQLASEGGRVAVTYTSQEERAREVFQSLAGEGHLLLPLNVADEESVNGCIDAAVEKWGKLDALVNNAGITRDQLLIRMKTADFDSVINTNLRGVFLSTRAFAKQLLRRKEPGAVVNVTSVVGEMGQAGQANYAASKAGVEGFTKSVARELASRQIRVNCVSPGFIETDMTAALTGEQRARILSQVPLESLGTAQDVAHGVAYLLSDEARYVTGHVLSINGGLYM